MNCNWINNFEIVFRIFVGQWNQHEIFLRDRYHQRGGVLCDETLIFSSKSPIWAPETPVEPLRAWYKGLWLSFAINLSSDRFCFKIKVSMSIIQAEKISAAYPHPGQLHQGEAKKEQTILTKLARYFGHFGHPGMPKTFRQHNPSTGIFHQRRAQ